MKAVWRAFVMVVQWAELWEHWENYRDSRRLNVTSFALLK
jgi:hypothetical protein